MIAGVELGVLFLESDLARHSFAFVTDAVFDCLCVESRDLAMTFRRNKIRMSVPALLEVGFPLDNSSTILLLHNEVGQAFTKIDCVSKKNLVETPRFEIFSNNDLCHWTS